jgi:hypothetical protein
MQKYLGKIFCLEHLRVLAAKKWSRPNNRPCRPEEHTVKSWVMKWNICIRASQMVKTVVVSKAWIGKEAVVTLKEKE